MKGVDENLKGMPKEGFLKLGRPARTTFSSTQRIALIRKGNEFFNAGKVDQAKKVFITTGYGDGLIRIGDYYLSKKDPLEALRMYWMAPAPGKAERILENAALVVRGWIEEGTGGNEERTDRRDEYPR